jgi:MoxR-like ATPase
METDKDRSTLPALLADVPLEPRYIGHKGSWPEAHHHWSEPELRALAAAAYSGRPLLVKGEPGVGKSQIARAAAALLGWRFEYEVITPRFEPQDLMWKFDAVRRLAAAQNKQETEEIEFVTSGALWRALDPATARPDLPKDERGPCVLLIDEIDKADSDLPNSLLEVLGNRGFTTPFAECKQVPADKDSAPQVLVVITSNNERELPAAFLRRCVVLEMKVPDKQADFEKWLLDRGAAQFGAMDGDVRREAAQQVWADRAGSQPGLGGRPGLAEYLDLLRAIDEITKGLKPGERVTKQRHWLGQLGGYILRKQGQPDPARPGSAGGSLDEAGDSGS